MRVLSLIAAVISLFSARAAELKLQQRYALASGERSYLTSGTNQRGLAYNPATGHLILVSRSGGISMWALDALTGDEIGALNVEGLAGGTFVLSKVGVTDDGVIYAANFGSIGAATPTFNIYRWENEAAAPTLAYAGDPGEGNIQQWGTTFDVRGSGADTQIIAGSTGGGFAALFTTEDGVNFTSKRLIGNASPDTFSVGLSFGPGNTLWAKAADGSLTHLSFDPAAGTLTVIKLFTASEFPSTVGPIGVNTANNTLVAVNISTPDTVSLYDISAPATLRRMDSDALPTDVANTLYMGAVDFAPNLVFVLNSNNGLVAYDVVEDSGPVVPLIIAQPTRTQTVRVGRAAQFTVIADGTAPLTYKWHHQASLADPELEIAGATSSTYRIAETTIESGGFYRVEVSNAAGSVWSATAELVIDPNPAPDALVQAWTLPVGSRTYLTTGDNQRGMAYNPVTGHLILVNRSGGISVQVLDARTGDHVGTMSVEGVSGGTFALSKIEVADDGVIYGQNFGSFSGTTPTIYRWANESATPTVAFRGNPDPTRANEQWGNVMNVRGSGVNTQIILPSRTGNLAILTTTDGVNFTSNPIGTDAPSNAFYRGVAFGEGNTFWGTSQTLPLYQVSFDLAAGTGLIEEEWFSVPVTIGPIAVDVQNKLLAGLSVATPDTVYLYDISDPLNGPQLLQSRVYPTDTANAQFAGALDFGGGMLFVLDTNNGITAYNLPFLARPELAIVRNANGTVTISWDDAIEGYTLQRATDLNAPEWTAVTDPQTVTGGQRSVTVSAATGNAFFRLAK